MDLKPNHRDNIMSNHTKMIKYFQRFKMKLPTSSSQIGGLPLSLIFGGIYLLPGAVAQYGFGASYRSYDCDKYCFASCSDYHGGGGPEFSACVQANLHCNCVTKFSYRNPFILFGLLAGIMILMSVCGMCYRWAAKGDRRTPHSIVTQPVTSNGRGNGAHIIANSRLGHSQTRSSQTSPRPSFVIPMGGSSQKLDNDLPPEYLPPPEYSSCVVNVDVDSILKERF